MNDLNMSIEELIGQIDNLEVPATKQQKLRDIDTEIETVESNLISLKRMLKQYHDAKALVQVANGGTIMLGPATLSSIEQLKRLRRYRSELEHLPGEDGQATEEDPPRIR